MIQKGVKLLIMNRRVRDSQKGGYGKISLARGFEVSSNTIMVQAVYDNYKNNPKKFVDHINRYEIKSSHWDLQIKGEGKPIIPQPGDKKLVRYNLALDGLWLWSFHNTSCKR